MQTLYKLPNFYELVANHLADTESEVNFLDKIFKKHKIKTILDVACGAGRHAILLARRGYKVRGIDYSQKLINRAKERAKKEKIKVEFILQNANAFSFPKKFDAAICMWNTLGEEPMRYRKVIKNVFTSLKPKGIFITENRSWEHVPKSNEATFTNTIKMKNGTMTKTKIHDRYTDNLRVRDIIYDIGGKKYEGLCITHTLKEKNWVEELKEAGFKKFKIYHDRQPQKIKKPAYVTIVAVK